MNYLELKTILASYLHRDDLTDMIPNFILLAQARISRDLDLLSMHTTDQLPFSAGCAQVELPAVKVLKLISVRIPTTNGNRTLRQQSLSQNSDETDAYPVGTSPEPMYYARYGSIIELSPTPAAAGVVDIIYKKRLQKFTRDTDTDEILSYYPNVYIYRSMVEASPFIEQEERVPLWDKLYSDEAARINRENEDFEWSGAPLRFSSTGADLP